MRLDAFKDDFGVSAFLNEVNITYDYILIDNDFKIEEVTEYLYLYLFHRHF